MAGAAGDIRVKILGWMHLMLGAGGLLGGSLLCLGLARTPGDKALAYVGPLFMLLATVYFVPCLLSGWGLLAGKSWGRLVAFVVSALLVMLFPVGTALGAFGVWTAFTMKPQPVKLRRASPLQAAYDLDPDRTETCIHLAPIEKAIRAAGVPLRPIADRAVRADCRVDQDGLIAAFQPPICVNYHEYVQGGRGAENVPVAQIDCADHRSAIQVVHPLEAQPETRWFPAPPAA